MRRLTLKEVNDEHGGILPPDAVFRPDTDEQPDPPAPAGKPNRRTRSERFAVLNTFTDATLAGLTGAEAKVWLVVFRDVKAATGTARTGQADIGRRAGLSVRGVRKALRGLERKGLLTVRRRGRLNAGPSVYAVRAGPSGILK
jgi:hypothetical protein